MNGTLWGRQGKFTFRMLAAVLGGQAIVVFFGALVARSLAAAGGDHHAARLWLTVGSGLALLSLLGAWLMRSPVGITIGWLVQLGCLAASSVVPMMGIIGVVFLALWVLCLVQGHRIDASMAQRDLEGRHEAG